MATYATGFFSLNLPTEQVGGPSAAFGFQVISQNQTDFEPGFYGIPRQIDFSTKVTADLASFDDAFVTIIGNDLEPFRLAEVRCNPPAFRTWVTSQTQMSHCSKSPLITVVALCAFVIVMSVANAWAQSGSTGGTIGNDEKSLSGSRPEPRRSDQDGYSCVVSDPTGTPLNLRTTPNGKIVGKISNGERIRILDQQIQGGKEWAYISNSAAQPIGWAFRRYLDCK